MGAEQIGIAVAKIMIVDDEPDIVLLVNRILTRAGHEVIGAGSGEEALEKLKNKVPDLILLDIMMPRLDGWETLKLIRGQDGFKNTPISMLTAKTLTPDVVIRGEIGELIDYLQKPVTKDGLIKKVSDILGVLQEIERKNAQLKEVVLSHETIRSYEIIARAERLHFSMLNTLKDVLGKPDAVMGGSGMNDAITSQERAVEMFRKRRAEIEKMLGDETNDQN